MGNRLSNHETKKIYVSGSDNDLSYGLCSMQGLRKSMEDAHCAKASLSGDWKYWSFFAIFDGHGGKEISKYCAKHLLDAIMKTEQFCSSDAKGQCDTQFAEKAQNGIKEAFLSLDVEMKHCKIAGENLYCGSTVISVFISSTHFYIANLGDSRGVISCDKEIRFVTVDHKPDNKSEKQRIERAGGFVFFRDCPRINDRLSVSRALGDYSFKQMPFKIPYEQIVSPEPDVYILDRYLNDEFLILACDGIWDVVKPKELCNYVRYMLQVTDNLENICKSIIEACFYKGSKDNMSILVILLSGAPKISEDVIQQDNKICSVLHKLIKDILSTHGLVTVDNLIKILSCDVKLQQEPVLKGSPFENSYYFLYSSVIAIYNNLRRDFLMKKVVRRFGSLLSNRLFTQKKT